MALLDQILEENARFVAQLPESYLHRNEKVSKYPARQLAIYTCMDMPWALRAAKPRLLRRRAT